MNETMNVNMKGTMMATCRELKEWHIDCKEEWKQKTVGGTSGVVCIEQCWNCLVERIQRVRSAWRKTRTYTERQRGAQRN